MKHIGICVSAHCKTVEDKPPTEDSIAQMHFKRQVLL